MSKGTAPLSAKETLATELGLTSEQLDDLIVMLARSCKKSEGPTTLEQLHRAVHLSYSTNRLVGDDLQAHNPVSHNVRTDGSGNETSRTPVYDRDPVYIFPEEEPEPAA